jgi:catechol 2,3-dioxygenase-like lactoylglutathione lyase family enzyme
MGLSRYKVAAAVAASDMDRARDFYEEKLGLSVPIDSGDNVQYLCGEGTMFHVYLSPEHAGNSTATLAGWGVDDIERVVDELASKGVAFERYDEGPIITNEEGHRHVRARSQGRLFQGPGRQHPLDRSSAAFLSALRRRPFSPKFATDKCICDIMARRDGGRQPPREEVAYERL